MKDNKKHNGIWVGDAQLQNDPAYHKSSGSEFFELPIVDQFSKEEQMEAGASRRDFLKYVGFGLGAATLAAGCEIPVKRAIPYVVKPDQIVPGVATYYASTFSRSGDYCPVLVKTREGRPIKIEGNPLSAVTSGGTSARAQAAVLELYNNSRITGPFRIKDGKIDKPSKKYAKGPSWEEIDQEITGKLTPASSIRIVTHTLMSPITKRAIQDFKAQYPDTEVVTYDPVSSAALLDANQQSFGERVIPGYRFDKADVIVGFDCDFLGTWISPIEFANQYAQNRRIKDTKNATMSHHVQVESHMSLTGSNADNRIMVKPSEQGAAIATLYNELARLNGRSIINAPKLDGEKTKKTKKLAGKLHSNRNRSLVVSGSNNLGEQVLVNAINDMLGSFGNTIDFSRPSLQRQGDDAAMQQLVKDMAAGKINALFVMDGANPAWDIPNAALFREATSKVGLKVTFTGVPNETLTVCDYVTPTHHFLESWGDVEPKRGSFSLVQPTISPLFNSRQVEETLLRWAGSEKLNTESDQPVYDYLRAHWEETLFPQQSEYATFQVFWDNTVHDGVFEIPAPEFSLVAFNGDVNRAATQVRSPQDGGLEISFYETVNMGGGQYADNPWLMEMPDPVTRTTWGNYLSIPVSWDGGNSFDALNGLNGREIYGEADIAELTLGNQTSPVTAVRSFGQMPDTVAIAIGYGRQLTGNLGDAIGEEIGVDFYPMLSVDANGHTQYYATDASLSKAVEKEKLFACVQYHHSMGLKGIDPKTNEEINVDEKTVMTLGSGFQGGLTDRSIIYQGSLKDLSDLEHHIEERRAEAAKLNENTLYPYEEYKEEVYSQGHHWAMHVDLNACIGCGACTIACMAENNVPVVGKKEVARHHEMTWLRIDRYFYGDLENPNVVYQPMMCQHCDNAPCENVCPVAATNHSGEGLNQMSYNRCIGTRYCANNCPYKVRRFNWLDYTTADLFPENEYTVQDEELPFGADNLTRMVLNPDVTVRSRGVIEKCSFCVQRIQEGKLTAKREGRLLQDNDVKTACQTACPTEAIVFGDRNNKEGLLAERLENPLNYLVLEETNTQSGVFYTGKVNNRDEELDA